MTAKRNMKKPQNKIVQIGIVSTACLLCIGIAYGLLQFFTAPSGNLVSVQTGKSVVLNFPGNESVELRWRLNKSKSTNLGTVNVRMLGWTYPDEQKTTSSKSAFGAIRTSRFEVYAKEPGESKLTFEFKKRGSSDLAQAIRTKTYRVTVTP